MKIENYLSTKIEGFPAVVGYLIRDNQILLGLRKKVSLGLGENLISGIGGKIGDIPGLEKETPEEAMIREAKEEIYIKIKSLKDMGKIKFIFPHKPKWNQDVFVYLIDKWEGEPRETEVIKPLWFKLDNLPKDRMWDDNLYWLPKVLGGEKINAVFLFDEKDKVKDYLL